ncbi:MAG: GT4 family glycosyltransferase PelF [Acetatifactor sp.]|nr:GT4 family glycosyltransferase PelF [Acetatifactor sp.]
MKICIVAEGCYPYVVGGVSGWINSMIKSFPQVEFVVLAIISNRTQSGKFVYELPANVTAVYEAYLDDYDWGRKPKHGKRTKLNKKEYLALRSIVMNEDIDWSIVFDMFQKKSFSIDDLLMGADFLNIVKECYQARYPYIVFSDFLWTMRSIYLPLFLILKTELPTADIYHCVATGYAGVLGSMAKHFHRSGLLISEHGIYTREREEELIKAEWVAGIYKNIWIDQFRKMSRLAYENADIVTSLYSHARELQIGLGCPLEKLRVTPNGIDVGRLVNLPGKKEEDTGFINIGAVLRVTPIKDVKTMIRAFSFAKEENNSLKLWIMGPCDEDEEYAKECFELVDALQVNDVVFTGRIDVKEYLGRMDFTILTSISEGQPLTILESYAAHKPVIATDVGNCRELIYGEGDGCGTAGILTHIMNTAELSAAMLDMARSSQLRKTMGECGYQRVMQRYQIHQMIQTYENIYAEIGWNYGKLLTQSISEENYGADISDLEGYGTDVPDLEEYGTDVLALEEYGADIPDLMIYDLDDEVMSEASSTPMETVIEMSAKRFPKSKGDFDFDVSDYDDFDIDVEFH